MFAIVLSIVLILAVVGVGSNIAMRIRLSQREPKADRRDWWKRGSDEVGDTYRALFPGGYLPLLNQLAFWLVVTLALFALIFAYLGKTR